jgi:hypothetical protein
LGDSPLRHITEHGRVVHAEMDALLSCSRNSVSTRGKTLYATTFPCHNCAKHIVAAGVQRVVYVQPYAKSKALKLHGDAVMLSPDETAECECTPSKKVHFEPFVGIGPRRFFDLFSMRLGSGRYVRRKDAEGRTVSWRLEDAVPRCRMLPFSYIDLEAIAARHFDSFRAKEESGNGER